MADKDEKKEAAGDKVLVAYVTVHLESGESFELLPFEDAEDVKSKVSDLLKAWAKSGFLVRGSEIYPWHRVQRIVATKVEEMSRSDSQLRRAEWEARETARLQQVFWKTKKARKEKDEDSESAGGEGGHKGMAA